MLFVMQVYLYVYICVYNHVPKGVKLKTHTHQPKLTARLSASECFRWRLLEELPRLVVTCRREQGCQGLRPKVVATSGP